MFTIINDATFMLLRRPCKFTCLIHVLDTVCSSLHARLRPFAHLAPAKVLSGMRHSQRPAHLYRSHDLRRDHDKDLKLNGPNLGGILRGGDQRSAAFLQYLDAQQFVHDRRGSRLARFFE